MPSKLNSKSLWIRFSLVNLRNYAKTESQNQRNPNQNPKNQNVSQQNENPDQLLTLRSGQKLKQKSNQKNSNKKSTPQTKPHDQPQNLQSEIHHPLPAPPTQTDSRAAQEWKNLDNPFSYSGNSVTILDQIKSFSWVRTLHKIE